VELVHAVRAWRAEGLACYFTIDAGPNVHVLTLPEAVDEVARRLAKVRCVERVIHCASGEGAHLVEEPRTDSGT
jgi:diphosphomevalonate decarboxylase